MSGSPIWTRTSGAVRAGVILVGVLLAGCAPATPATSTAPPPASTQDPSPRPSFTLPSTAPSVEPSVDRDVVAGLFDVGGHSLYLTCSGTGSPTVVHFHGYVDDRAFSGIYSAIPVQERLQDRYRTCLYDRANVGVSGFADGPLSGQTSVADLHALLAAADERGPFVLLGSSFGGLIAYMYALTYPDEVVGMVLLDPSLPDELSRIADVVLPPDYQLLPNEWRSSVEQIDRLATYRQAEALIGKEPPIPVILLGTTTIEIPPELPVAEITRLSRQLQQEFVDRFSPGELILVDAPHYMEPAIPDRIVAEVTRLIEELR